MRYGDPSPSFGIIRVQGGDNGSSPADIDSLPVLCERVLIGVYVPAQTDVILPSRFLSPVSLCLRRILIPT